MPLGVGFIYENGHPLLVVSTSIAPFDNMHSLLIAK